MKLAIVGCGGMAETHLRAYITIKQMEPEKFEFVAMCDPVLASAERFANTAAQSQTFKPRVYSSLDYMLSREELDAVDICTPHSEHHRAAIACLNAGANVMVEKPFGVTVKASKAIIEAAKRNNKIVAVAENIRRGLSQRTAYWIINELKMLGEPRLFFAQHASWQDPMEERIWHWRIDRMLSGGGMVMDSGAHFADMLRYLYGDPEMIYARVTQFEKWPHRKGDKIVYDEREDSWIAIINFENGLICTWSWTIAAPGYSHTNVVHYGSRGCLLDHGDVFHGPFDNAEVIIQDGSKKIVYPMKVLEKDYLNSLDDERRKRLFPYGITNGVFIECYDFLEAIEKGRKPEVDGEEGLKAKAICEAIYESAYLGQPVNYRDVLEGRIEAYQKSINEYFGL
ncbi:Gfo/Idh/MocA family oxidoreductase [Candidatus Bathyarchaeota archaeon]|nr:Gfo/Idh/MocA family oxidoreductase [Candidatus Bathyarchaeota archaeon]